MFFAGGSLPPSLPFFPRLCSTSVISMEEHYQSPTKTTSILSLMCTFLHRLSTRLHKDGITEHERLNLRPGAHAPSCHPCGVWRCALLAEMILLTSSCHRREKVHAERMWQTQGSWQIPPCDRFGSAMVWRDIFLKESQKTPSISQRCTDDCDVPGTSDLNPSPPAHYLRP